MQYIVYWTPSDGNRAWDFLVVYEALEKLQGHNARMAQSVELRYFGGNTPSEIRYEPPWEDAKFVQVRDRTEALPGFFLVSTRSEIPGTREMNEISLVIKTSRGGVLVVGDEHLVAADHFDRHRRVSHAHRRPGESLRRGTR